MSADKITLEMVIAAKRAAAKVFGADDDLETVFDDKVFRAALEAAFAVHEEYKRRGLAPRD